jgi:hypothetical protein
MTGLNNTISKSLKVCHNKFTPIGATAIFNPNTQDINYIINGGTQLNRMKK